MSEYPSKRSFFIGRWQPLHAGHIAIIRTALDEGRQVVIGIMETPPSRRNPFNLLERGEMFGLEFGLELEAGRMKVLPMPWIDEVCYGRDCGWRTRRIHLDPEIEAVSATEIRHELEAGTWRARSD